MGCHHSNRQKSTSCPSGNAKIASFTKGVPKATVLCGYNLGLLNLVVGLIISCISEGATLSWGRLSSNNALFLVGALATLSLDSFSGLLFCVVGESITCNIICLHDYLYGSSVKRLDGCEAKDT
ncbi:hypothetical protein Tco_0937397 [Tanacetum coccineum]|uniref:Uncharacterized protein n=1 Tax=Tanacetum coccineum TaxID=301880 RepID=A0ABQ5DGR2_9ASTR